MRDLAALAAELYERSRRDAPDEDPGLGFEDRAVRLETTFGGAGVLGGDLTPACAAVVGAVLDALSAPAGAGHTRTRAQRYHDGLQEAMTRWNASWAAPPCAVGSVSGSITFSSSRTDPGQPWVTISGSASWWRERTWMKWMSRPSISVMNCGRAFSLASALRQS